MSKVEKYMSLIGQTRELLAGETDQTACMANLAAVLHEAFGFWWTGFYRVVGDELVLGPFQGPPACTRIAKGRGVCGTAWNEQRTLVVPDVEQFPGHIACSSQSRSEIVVPVWGRGEAGVEIRAVLDIDSREKGTFDATDKKYLEKIVSPLFYGGLHQYVEAEILPRYDHFDRGHSREHVETVIRQALDLSRYYDVDENMIYAAAAYHDTGICEGRETHHTVSARIIRADKNLLKWFTPEQIDTIADAAQDHRASSDREPRTIYGRIVAEADREIVPETIIRRTIQFGIDHYPETDREGHWQRTLEHMHEKYAEGGYLKLWIRESPNVARLEELRSIIRDERLLRAYFERIFEEETKKFDSLTK